MKTFQPHTPNSNRLKPPLCQHQNSRCMESAKTRSEYPSSPISTPISPPYWQHHRALSHASVDSTSQPNPISLEDHTEAHCDSTSALWAKDITVEDYVIVRGGSTGIGAYVVWNCKVQTLDVRSCGFKSEQTRFLADSLHSREVQ